MSELNGHKNPQILRPSFTPVILRASVSLSCREGVGHACIILPFQWPGIPQVGNVVMHGAFLWPFEVRVRGVAIDIDDEDNVPHVHLSTFNLKRLRDWPDEAERPMRLGRQLFLACLSDLTDAGWGLVHDASWRPRENGELEKFKSAFFYNAAGGDEEGA